MADQEHLDMLAKGIEAWNSWRENSWQERSHVWRPDLQNADLRKTNLRAVNGTSVIVANLRDTDLRGANCSGADLRNACLSGAILRSANLTGALVYEADLSGADLREANLTGARLMDTNLRGSVLAGADLSSADLSGADLRDTHLEVTNLSDAKLTWADLGGAHFAFTILGDVDLSEAKGLETVCHDRPSTVGVDTIYRSKGKIPERFLRGAGMPDTFIAYVGSLAGATIEFYSCFISYSTKDQDFADRLYDDLQAKGVRCWFAPHNIQGGKKVHEQIDEAIRVHDKLLLVLSPHSIESEWVKTEIAKARKREIRERKRVLFPIRLVDFETLRGWECFDADTGKDSAREIREYFVSDFSTWKDHNSYREAFDRLLRDLQADAAAGAIAGR